MKKLILLLILLHCAFSAIYADNPKEILELIEFVQTVDAASASERESLTQNLEKEVLYCLHTMPNIDIDFMLELKNFFMKNPLLFFRMMALRRALEENMITPIKPLLSKQFIEELIGYAKTNPLYYYQDDSKERKELFYQTLKDMLPIFQTSTDNQEVIIYATLRNGLHELERVEKQLTATAMTVYLGCITSIASATGYSKYLQQKSRKINPITGKHVGRIASLIAGGFAASLACGYFVWQYYEEPTA